MDDYLDCLYQYILEERLDQRLRDSAERRRVAQKGSDLLDTLHSQLTPDQRAMLDEFCSISMRLHGMETDVVFQEAVALGKWMVR